MFPWGCEGIGAHVNIKLVANGLGEPNPLSKGRLSSRNVRLDDRDIWPDILRKDDVLRDSGGSNGSEGGPDSKSNDSDTH